MKKISKLLYIWGPTVIWMRIIFYLSSRPHFEITTEATSDFFIFKVLHMMGYAMLYFLMTRSFFKAKKKESTFKYAFICSFLYALSDEIHQLFVPTREGRFRDVIIDTVGMTIMYIFLSHYLHLFKKYIKYI